MLHKSYKVFNPKFVLFFSTRRPCFTIARFNLINGTTSHTVANATKSKKSKIFGSFILFNLNQFSFLNLLFKAIKKTKHTPAAQR